MATKEALPAAQEAEARQLAEAIARAAADELLHLARTLVAAGPASLFGATEFQVRDLLLQVGAKAYEQHLAQKKSATTAPG